MPGAARLNDTIAGITAGEHSGHLEPHYPSTIDGEISGGCSANVFINGRPAATVGSVTTEHDSCCGTGYGSVGAGSSTVFINGKSAARTGDALNAHNGSGNITGGSSTVFLG